MANATLILVLLLVVTVNGTVVWFIPDTFAPKEFLQFVVAVATFAIGMTQNAFGKYIADMWTDRRRTNEARTERTKTVSEVTSKTEPVLHNLRKEIARDESGLIRVFNYCKGNFVTGGGANLKIVSPSDFDKHKLMLDQLANINLLQIEKGDDHYVHGRLSEELVELLRDLPLPSD